MNYSKIEIEKFILLGYAPKKNRSVEKNLLVSGHWSCFVSMMIWISYHLLMFAHIDLGFTQEEYINVLYTNVAILLLIPIVIIITIRLSKDTINNFAKPKNHKKHNGYLTIFSTIGASVGVIVARLFLSNISPSTGMVVFSVLVVIIVLIFTFCTCISYYKVYLIRKFCPYLNDRFL